MHYYIFVIINTLINNFIIMSKDNLVNLVAIIVTAKEQLEYYVPGYSPFSTPFQFQYNVVSL
jgi:hypothetical protein